MMVSLSVSFVKWPYASFLLFAVALIFASGDAEALWEQQEDVPSDYYGNGAAFYYDSESDIGILIELNSCNQDEVWAYDYNTDTWTQKAALPTP